MAIPRSPNLAPNPEFATDLSDWVSDRTFSRVTTLPAALPGEMAGEVTTGSQMVGEDNYSGITMTAMQTATSFTIPNETHTFSAYVYVPAAWNGSQLRFDLRYFVGATVEEQVTANMSVRDEWQRIYTVFTPAPSDVFGRMVLAVVGSWSIGETLYATAFMSHAGSSPEPYLDVPAPTSRVFPVLKIGSSHIGPMRVGERN